MKLGKAIEAATVGLLLLGSAWIVLFLYGRVQPLGMDFAPVWAANPSIAYDPAAVTEAHPFPVATLRPFAYPPTALLLFTPLRMLPFDVAYLLFAWVGFALFVWASIRAGAKWWVAAFAPVLLLVHVGQPTLIVGGLLLSGLVVPKWRGPLFGLSIIIKPQLCLFLPLLLLFDRDWRNAAVAVGTVSIFCGATTAAYGLPIWADWISASRQLLATVTSNPTLADDMIHLNPYVFAIPAILLVWFTRNSDSAMRLAGVVGAALLVSPYAMSYELALLAPAAASIPVLSVALSLGFFFAPTATLLFVVMGLGLQRTWRSTFGRTLSRVAVPALPTDA